MGLGNSKASPSGVGGSAAPFINANNYSRNESGGHVTRGPGSRSAADNEKRGYSGGSRQTTASSSPPTDQTTSSATVSERYPALDAAQRQQQPAVYKYLGLQNFGNTCYCNSVLQVLFHCDPFRQNCLRSGKRMDGLLPALADLFDHIETQRRGRSSAPVAPKKFIQKLRQENELFNSAEHHDAHEFFNYLMNDIAENLVKQPSPSLDTPPPFLPSSSSGRGRKEPPTKAPGAAVVGTAGSADTDPRTWIHSLFEGSILYETKCLCCENRTRRREPFLDISVEVDNSSLETCINRVATKEKLVGKDKYFCDYCSCLQEAERCSQLGRLPPYLAVHLKRFKFDESQNRYARLPHKVSFPMELSLPTAEGETEKRDYTLFAVIVHIGVSTSHGHYISCLQNADKWLLFDDHSVKPISAEHLSQFFGGSRDGQGTKCAYLVFYAANPPVSSTSLPPPAASSRAAAEPSSHVTRGNGLPSSASVSQSAITQLHPTNHYSTSSSSSTPPISSSSSTPVRQSPHHHHHSASSSSSVGSGHQHHSSRPTSPPTLTVDVSSSQLPKHHQHHPFAAANRQPVRSGTPYQQQQEAPQQVGDGRASLPARTRSGAAAEQGTLPPGFQHACSLNREPTRVHRAVSSAIKRADESLEKRRAAVPEEGSGGSSPPSRRDSSEASPGRQRQQPQTWIAGSRGSGSRATYAGPSGEQGSHLGSRAPRRHKERAVVESPQSDAAGESSGSRGPSTGRNYHPAVGAQHRQSSSGVGSGGRRASQLSSGGGSRRVRGVGEEQQGGWYSGGNNVHRGGGLRGDVEGEQDGRWRRPSDET